MGNCDGVWRGRQNVGGREGNKRGKAETWGTAMGFGGEDKMLGEGRVISVGKKKRPAFAKPYLKLVLD